MYIYTVSQKKIDLLAWDHLRRFNFFWDTMYNSKFLECVVCPPLNATGETLMEGEHYEVDNSGCCPIQKKVCVKEICEPQEDCSENLVKIPDPATEDACCPKFKCGRFSVFCPYI